MVNTELKGRTLTVAANLSPPYTFLETYSNGTTLFTGGIEVEFLNALKNYFKFNYQAIDCNSNWGSFINGTWTGVVGNVFSKKADLGFGGLSMTYERYKAVDFSKIYLYTPVTFITPPPGLKPPVKLILEPFDLSVWITTLFSLIFVIVSQRLIVNKMIKDTKSDISWALISCLLRQEMPKKFPSLTSIRLIYLFWSFACLIIATSYAGCLYSLMTIPSRNPTIDTIEDLAKAQTKGKIQVVGIAGSSYFQALKSANTGIYHEIGSLMKSVKSKVEGLEVVKRTKKHSYISNRDHLMYAIVKSAPNTYYLPPQTEDSTFFVDAMALAMNKNFPYKQQFDYFISSMIVGGFFDFWRKNEFRKFVLERGRAEANEEKQTDQSDLIKPLTVEQLQSAFYFFVLGISASSITLMIEYKIKPKKRFKRVVQKMIMTRRLMESQRQTKSKSKSNTPFD